MPTFSVYLRDGLDDDVADRLASEANQCEAIRQALRAWYGRDDDLGAILERLDRIEVILENGATVARTETSDGDEVDASSLNRMMGGW